MSAHPPRRLPKAELEREVVAAYLHGCEPNDITYLRDGAGYPLDVRRVEAILWRAGVPRRRTGAAVDDLAVAS